MRTVFVTSSGTGIGKTFVTVRLIRALQARQVPVRALKPLITDWLDENAAESDTGLILSALGEAVTPETVARISPWRYAAALAPDMAAARQGCAVPYAEVLAFCAQARAAGPEDGILIVEGAGGVLVPVDGTHTMRDMMTALEAAPLLVVGSYLGTISHTLTALESLQSRGLPPLAIAVSESPDTEIPLEETCAAIARHAGNTPVIAVPRGAGAGDAAFARLAALALDARAQPQRRAP